MERKFSCKSMLALLAGLFCAASPAFASEADLVVPNIAQHYPLGYQLLLIGIGVSVLGLIFGLIAFAQVKSIKVHECMANVGNTIFETCKTYLVQQGKFLIALETITSPILCFSQSKPKQIPVIITALSWGHSCSAAFTVWAEPPGLRLPICKH